MAIYSLRYWRLIDLTDLAKKICTEEENFDWENRNEFIRCRIISSMRLTNDHVREGKRILAMRIFEPMWSSLKRLIETKLIRLIVNSVLHTVHFSFACKESNLNESISIVELFFSNLSFSLPYIVCHFLLFWNIFSTEFERIRNKILIALNELIHVILIWIANNNECD